MEIKGEYKIAAPRDKVFAALNDQAILQACIPGCETLEKLSDTEMTAKVRLRIGPVSAGFSGKVTLSDIDPPNGYKISGEGQGGVAGFAKGGAVVKLTEDAGETLLSYEVDAQVGGKIAQVGARLIQAQPRSWQINSLASSLRAWAPRRRLPRRNHHGAERPKCVCCSATRLSALDGDRHRRGRFDRGFPAAALSAA